jgi:hypothetical protein
MIAGTYPQPDGGTPRSQRSMSERSHLALRLCAFVLLRKNPGAHAARKANWTQTRSSNVDQGI